MLRVAVIEDVLGLTIVFEVEALKFFVDFCKRGRLTAKLWDRRAVVVFCFQHFSHGIVKFAVLELKQFSYLIAGFQAAPERRTFNRQLILRSESLFKLLNLSFDFMSGLSGLCMA